MKKKLFVVSLLILIAAFFSACGQPVSVNSAIPGIPGDGGTNSLMVGWTAPTTNEDGSPLMDLAGYRLYYGYGSRDYSFVANVNKAFTAAEIGGLSTTTWYITVTAYDYFGNESIYSNEIIHTFY